MEEAAAAASNGGLLYHEVQEGKLCAVHCVNTTLQGPFFSEFDLAALAADLDQRERQVMSEGAAGAATTAAGDFLAEGEGSHNVSLGGDFSIQVLQKALEVWDLQVIPLDSPAAGSCLFDPELETAFICHLQDHWFCIRKVNGEWYNFNSLYPAPEHLSKFYLSAFIDTLKGSGWSIFAVRGNFPKECPMATEGSNGFGQWLTPDDARRITASCNQVQTPIQQADISLVADQSQEMSEMDMIAAQQEEADLNAAIAASLMDTGGPFASYSASHEESRSQDAFASESASGEMSKDSNLEQRGANKSEPSELHSDNIVSASGSIPEAKSWRPSSEASPHQWHPRSSTSSSSSCPESKPSSSSSSPIVLFFVFSIASFFGTPPEEIPLVFFSHFVSCLFVCLLGV